MPYQLNVDRPYKPKTEKNRRSWEVVVGTIKAGHGKANLKDIQTALTYKWKNHEGKEEETAHTNFVRYMIRGRHIVETPKEESKDGNKTSTSRPEQPRPARPAPKPGA